MHVQRQPVRRGRRPSWLVIGMGCAATVGMCGVIAIVGLIVLLPRLPNLAASAAGLEERGSTAAIFQQAAPLPTVALQNAVEPEQVTVNLGDYGGAQNFSGSTAAYEVQVGSAGDGLQTAVITFTEAGLLDLCRQRSDICRGSNPQFQNATIDLRPGGAIIYADVAVPAEYGLPIQQRAGAVLQLDSSGRQFRFAGIDLNGSLYALSTSGELGSLAERVETTGNDLLNQLTVNAGNGQFALSEVLVDDNTLTLVMK